MRRMFQAVVISVLAVPVLVSGQGADAKRVLSELRAALGGEEKLGAVKTVAIEGQVTRPGRDGTSNSSHFEMAFELPDKFMKSDVFAVMNGNQLMRRSGFSGAEGFEDMDAPPGMMGGGGGGMHVMRMGPGGGTPGGQASPEQIAKQRAQSLTINRREFARLALGMFGASYSPLPLEFKHAGQAEAQDGKADVIEVQGPDGFAAKLFVDGKSRLPLMLSWMDREPLRIQMSPGQDMAELQRQAEANRRTVEFRMFYADYKSFDGVKLPTRIQRMMDGIATEEMALEKIKVNTKIDASKFKSPR